MIRQVVRFVVRTVGSTCTLVMLVYTGAVASSQRPT